jgi:DNA-binding transcriptional ArsR family regulator
MSKARKTDLSAMLSPAVFEVIAPVLRVLGHPDRLRILDLLVRRSVPVTEIAEELDLAPNAVSQHLTMMQARGVLARHRQGRNVFYAVVHPAAKSLLQCMHRNAAEFHPPGAPEASRRAEEGSA